MILSTKSPDAFLAITPTRIFVQPVHSGDVMFDGPSPLLRTIIAWTNKLEQTVSKKPKQTAIGVHRMDIADLCCFLWRGNYRDVCDLAETSERIGVGLHGVYADLEKR